METQLEGTCPSCHSIISADANFCANCGKQLRDKPLAITLSKQIIIYFVSLFLPPFGLWYAWKYLKQKDGKSKRIGIVAVILTIISTLIAIWFTVGFINSITQSLYLINNLNF